MTIRLFFLAAFSALICQPNFGQAQDFEVGSIPLPMGASALTYGDDGTLYVLSGDIMGPGLDSILAIAPDGTQSSINLSAGAALNSLGGAAFDSTTGAAGRILVTDQEGAVEGNLLSIDVATGQTDVLVSGFDFIDDVGIRSTGEIFFTNAAGGTDGALYQLDSSGTAVEIVDGLGFAAGITFDPDGNLLFQDVDANDFTASISRLSVTVEADGSLSFGTAEELLSGLQAGFDLVADGEGDLFVTGSGGLFELERDADGNFLAPTSPLISAGFSTELAFFDGTVDFEPDSIAGLGDTSPVLAFIPEFGASTVTTLSVTAVPEPTTALLFIGMAGCYLTQRRRLI